MAPEAPGACPLAWPGAAVEGYPRGRVSGAPTRRTAPVPSPHASPSGGNRSAPRSPFASAGHLLVLTRRLFDEVLGQCRSGHGFRRDP